MKLKIEINTSQIDYISNQKDSIRFSSSAELIKKEKFDIITYEEKDGEQKTKTVLKIYDDSLRLIKYAKNISNMYFKEGAYSNSNYSTAYGNFGIDVLTKKMDIKKFNNSDIIYDINLEYEINIQGLFNGLNILKIQVKNDE